MDLNLNLRQARGRNAWSESEITDRRPEKHCHCHQRPRRRPRPATRKITTCLKNYRIHGTPRALDSWSGSFSSTQPEYTSSPGGFLLTRLSLSDFSSCSDCHEVATHKRAIFLIIDSLRFDFITPNPPNPPSSVHHGILTLPREITAKYPKHSFIFNAYADPPTATPPAHKGTNYWLPSNIC